LRKFFARSQSLQSRVRDLFSGFGPTSEFFLAGNDVKLRLGRAGAKRANTDSVRFHLFREAFGEKQVERFRGRVGGNIRNGLKRSGRSQDQNIATAARDHSRQIQSGQMDYRVAIHLQHVEHSLLFNGMGFAVLAKASIVDQQLDLNSFFLGEGENIFRGIRIRQICREHSAWTL